MFVTVGIILLLIALYVKTAKPAFITLAVGFGVTVVQSIIYISLDFGFLFYNLTQEGWSMAEIQSVSLMWNAIFFVFNIAHYACLILGFIQLLFSIEKVARVQT
jgi:hypothetical protein